MQLRRLFPVIAVFALAVPVFAQEPVDPLLKAASKALDHYQQIAPGIRCEDATTKELRDSCKITLEDLETRVQDAKAQIARYRQLSKPQAVDLFDAYESFRRVMDRVESLNFAPEFYGEHNRVLFAEAYNTLVKVTGWFEGVVRETIQDAGKPAERSPS
jgi:hypothetical protein